MASVPRVSIGMPAYNSAGTIRASIISLLDQSYRDFELIVSDNASTDGTAAIVEDLARADSRIKLFRQTENIGANSNYSFVMRASQGEFFKWSSSSDWCAPTLLERCLHMLDSHDDTVLTVPRTRLFKDNVDDHENYDFDIDVLDDAPSARFRNLIENLALNNVINGLIRTSVLRRTTLIEPYVLADIVLMGQLALFGKFRLVEEPLFYRRLETKTSTAMQDRDSIRRHHYPTESAKALFQASKRQIGWLRAVGSVPLPARERARCLLYVLRMCYWERRDLIQDVSTAWAYARSGRLRDW